MNRKELLTSIKEHFAKEASKLSDETLTEIKEGKLVIRLQPAVGEESGGFVKRGNIPRRH